MQQDKFSSLHVNFGRKFYRFCMERKIM